MAGIILQESERIAILPQQSLRELSKLRRLELVSVAMSKRNLFWRVMLATDRLGNVVELILGAGHPSGEFFERNPLLHIRRFDLRAPHMLELMASSPALDLSREEGPACKYSFRQLLNALLKKEEFRSSATRRYI